MTITKFAWDEKAQQVKNLESKLEEMQKTLEWYAYDAEEETRKFHFGAIHSKIGERARQALKGVINE